MLRSSLALDMQLCWMPSASLLPAWLAVCLVTGWFTVVVNSICASWFTVVYCGSGYAAVLDALIPAATLDQKLKLNSQVEQIALDDSCGGVMVTVVGGRQVATSLWCTHRLTARQTGWLVATCWPQARWNITLRTD